MLTDSQKKRLLNNMFKVSLNKKAMRNPYEGKMLFNGGTFYTTDGYMIIKAYIDEYSHLGEDRFEDYEVQAWEDQAHNFIEPRLMEPSISGMREPTKRLDEFFDRWSKGSENEDMLFDAKLLKKSLEPFAITGIYPKLKVRDSMMYLQGSDKGTSIQVILMGVRK